MGIASFQTNNLLPSAFIFASFAYPALAVIDGAFAVDGHNIERDAICPSNSSLSTMPSGFVEQAAARARACLPTPANAYLSGMKSKAVLRKTPQYVHQIMHPGYSYAPEGTTGFTIQNERMLSHEQAESLHAVLRNALKSNPQLREQVRAGCPMDRPIERGCEMQVNSDKLLIRIPPEKMLNHRASLKFLRSWVGNIDTLSETEINDNLLQAHKLLFEGIAMKGADLGGAGAYRKDDTVVFRDNAEDKDRSPENLIRLIRKRGGSQQDVAVYKKMVKNMQEGLVQPGLNEEQRKALSFLGYVPGSFQDVPERMQQFAKELKETVAEMKRCGNIDPIALGVFVHRKIGEIQPFGDGNGRIARAFMNAMLMEYGMEPVVFLNDEQYSNAIERDSREPGYFTKYVTSIVIPKMETARKDLDLEDLDIKAGISEPVAISGLKDLSLPAF